MNNVNIGPAAMTPVVPALAPLLGVVTECRQACMSPENICCSTQTGQHEPCK